MKKVLVVMIILVLSTSVFCSDDLRLSGFFTFGAGAIDKGSGAGMYGYTKDISLLPDTLFALQIDKDISTNISATLQLIARADASRGVKEYSNKSYDLSVEWGYLSYKPISELTLRAGRMRTGFFLYSDSLDVGYTYPWVKPPEEVYNIGILPMTAWNAVDGIYQNSFSDINFTLQLGVGQEQMRNNKNLILDYTKSSVIGQNIDINKWWALNTKLEWNNISVRAIYSVAYDLNIDVEAIRPLVDALRKNNFTSTADKLEIKNSTGRFFGVGFNANLYNFEIIGEYTQIKHDSILMMDSDSYFITLAYKIAEIITPNITYASVKGASDVAGISTGNSGTDTAFGLTSLTNNDCEEKSITMGIRFDLLPQVALKTELNRTLKNSDAKYNRMFVRNVAYDEDVNLYRAAISVVY